MNVASASTQNISIYLHSVFMDSVWIFRTVSLDGTNLFILACITWMLSAYSDKIQVTVELRASDSWRLNSVCVHACDISKQRFL